jgi:Carboxypeptidase regulatory-like domain
MRGTFDSPGLRPPSPSGRGLARIIYVILAAQILAGQGPGPASVQGVAFIVGTEDPVSGSVVELRPVGGSTTEPIFAATQANGDFLFRAVPAGRYLLVATRNGYLPAELGQRSATGRGVPIVIAGGQQLSGVRVGMTPTAAVSGRILDRVGQPMAGVTVQALKPIFQEGRRTMSVMKSMLTNDLGEYRIFWLPPGSYYLNVIPPQDGPGGGGTPLVINPYAPPAGRSLWWNPSSVSTSPVGNGLPEAEAYLPIFFPGTPDESVATALELPPGADVRNIDIRVAPIRALRVRGLVLNGASRQPMNGVGVQLISLGASPRVLQATSDDMGRYVIPKVPPGPYLLAGMSPRAGLGRLMAIEARDSDIEANIELQPFYSLSGHVVAPNPTALTVRLRLDYGIPNPPQINATPAADGSFTLRNIPPGDYRVFVSPILQPQALPPAIVPAALRNTYVKTMRIGDIDLLNGRLRLDRPPESSIEILVATDAGSLGGRVLDSQQAPLPGATVVLMPDLERRSLRTDLYRTASTDETGRFVIENLPAGDYRVFSWENVADFAWQDPAFMRDYEERGLAVRITEGTRQTLDLTSIP